MRQTKPIAWPKEAKEVTHSGKRPRAPEPHRGGERPKTVHELARERGKLRSPPPSPKHGGVEERAQAEAPHGGTAKRAPAKRQTRGTARPHRTNTRPRAIDHSPTDKQQQAASLRARASGIPGKMTGTANHKTRAVGPSGQGGSQVRASDADAHKLGVDPDVWTRVQAD